MLRLNVFIQVSADNRAAVMEAAKELVACSLKDNGCIAYDIFESATREDVLMICETWKDEESLAAHEKAAHFVTLVPKMCYPFLQHSTCFYIGLFGITSHNTSVNQAYTDNQYSLAFYLSYDKC